MPEHGLPWKRGIGNDACKIWDKDGHLVCELESSSDSTFLVECVNEYSKLKKALSAEEPKTGPRHGEQVMVSTKKGTFRCDCGCNVFTRIGDSSSFLCNACKAKWHGEPYAPFVNAAARKGQ